MVAGEGSETGSATGPGLGDLKLAQARKRRIEEELYRLPGTSYAEQSSSPSLQIPDDLMSEYRGKQTMNDLLSFMRQQVLSYPLPFVFLQYMKDSYRSDLGIRKPDLSLLHDTLKTEFAAQDALLWKSLHDRLSQPLRDRLYNTHSFAQLCPTVTIENGVARNHGLLLAFSICFCNREDHSMIESRVRNRLYSYHLAMKTQPLPELVAAVRADLAEARKARVKVSWSETGAKWANAIASRSILYLGRMWRHMRRQGINASPSRTPTMLSPCCLTL